MKDLPAPGARQLATLSNLLNTMSTDYGMSRENLDLRFQVFNAIKSLFEKKIKGTRIDGCLYLVFDTVFRISEILLFDYTHFELRRASKFPFSPCCTLTLYYSRTCTNIKYRLISEININTTRTIANLIIQRESLLPTQVLRASGTLVCQFTVASTLGSFSL